MRQSELLSRRDFRAIFVTADPFSPPLSLSSVVILLNSERERASAPFVLLLFQNLVVEPSSAPPPPPARPDLSCGPQIYMMYSAPQKSLCWVECFSTKRCENCCEADGKRQRGGGGIFKNVQGYFGITVYSVSVIRACPRYVIYPLSP